jgi:hypothetical protein
MKYLELFKEENEEIMERFHLSMDRIQEIMNEESVKEPYLDYFKKVASFILQIKELVSLAEHDRLSQMSLEELQNLNHKLYEDILPENYETSYANPRYATKILSKRYGKLLSFLYTEIRGMIAYGFEHRLVPITIYMELFIEIYNYFEEEGEFTHKDVKRSISDFMHDYCPDFVEYRTRELLDSSLTFAKDIIMTWDLSDLRYLYQFGEYIDENEIEIAKFLNSMPEEEVKAMAFTYTDGYKRGFENQKIDLSRKETVVIRYNIGFERMVRYAIQYFSEMGLEPILYRAAVNSVSKRQHLKIGYHSTGPNRQYDYDHRYDNGLYLNKDFNDRKLTGQRNAYEKYKSQAVVYAGPALIEVFGEKNFSPENKEEAIRLDKRQQKLYVNYNRDVNLLTNEYIKGGETSFYHYRLSNTGDRGQV